MNLPMTLFGYDAEITGQERNEINQAIQAINAILTHDFSSIPRETMDAYIQAAENLSYRQNGKTMRTISRYMLGIGLAMLCTGFLVLGIFLTPAAPLSLAVTIAYFVLTNGGLAGILAGYGSNLFIPGEDMKQYGEDMKQYAEILNSYGTIVEPGAGGDVPNETVETRPFVI